MHCLPTVAPLPLRLPTRRPFGFGKKNRAAIGLVFFRGPQEASYVFSVEQTIHYGIDQISGRGWHTLFVATVRPNNEFRVENTLHRGVDRQFMFCVEHTSHNGIDQVSVQIATATFSSSRPHPRTACPGAAGDNYLGPARAADDLATLHAYL